MSCTIDIAIEASGWADVAGLEPLVTAAVDATLRDGELPGGRDGEVSILLCDDTRIRELNRIWRDTDKATNVLSFPAEDVSEGYSMYGDIAVAFETVAREAAREDKILSAHLSHLVVHGMLHLLGHDHETGDEAEEMEAAERRILATLGIADPYAGTELAKGDRPA